MTRSDEAAKPLNMYAKPDGASTGTTPMMQQYLAARAEARASSPGCLLFYRMGDFYELFFEDAEAAAAALEIALTKRGQHAGVDIPMCGVPVHAAEGYLARLIRKGFRVAVAEQMEDPAEARKRGTKAVVRRDIVRIITPGTLSDDALLEGRAANHLVAVASVGEELALAWCDMSAGGFAVMTVAPTALEAELARLAPSEILHSSTADFVNSLTLKNVALTPCPPEHADSLRAERALGDFYGTATLDGLAGYSRAQLSAAGLILYYLRETQRGILPRLGPLRCDMAAQHMMIDAATRTSLELTRSLSGDPKNSLLGSIDATQTSAGARLLALRLGAPATDPALINERLDLVETFWADSLRRGKLRAQLKGLPDIARALQRLSLARGTARDLAAVRDGLRTAIEVRAQLRALQLTLLAAPEALTVLTQAICDHAADVDLLMQALVAEPPLDMSGGHFIAPGYDAALDALRSLSGESRRHIAALETQYQTETKVATLKVRHNNVIGYHIEVSARQADGLLANPAFIHRQTMANAVRFSTTALNELASSILEASARALALEKEHFERLRTHVVARAADISRTTGALAELDVATSLAECAALANWVRPRVDQSLAFSIAGGRHPVVEASLARQRVPFIANDCDLATDQRLWVVTGPNMAGKSTFLRQNALMAVLAQMGSFVPATAAHIGIVDRLFSRVGAADDLAQGRSTFMVEMVETAAILNQAGPKSLVILDEVGRGTATYDGLAIAWASVEHLHDVNRCRALFATHYHELTALKARLPHIALYTVAVKVHAGQLLFLHHIQPGSADRSYGINVAQMAELPRPVLDRAAEILLRLETDASQRPTTVLTELPLFAAQARSTAEEPPTDPLREALATVRPDELTPRAALDLLYQLKTLL